jgi:hypothetical protein
MEDLMRALIGAMIMVTGILLLAWGLDASDSFGSKVSRFFTGAPTDRTVWLTVGGSACLVLGVGLLTLSRRRPKK